MNRLTLIRNIVAKGIDKAKRDQEGEMLWKQFTKRVEGYEKDFESLIASLFGKQRDSLMRVLDAEVEKQMEEYAAKYSRTQPRDRTGRWTSGGSAGAGGVQAAAGEALRGAMQEIAASPKPKRARGERRPDYVAFGMGKEAYSQFTHGSATSASRMGHGEGINPAFIVKIQGDGEGIWKGEKGERKDWSQMDKKKCTWAKREAMAYAVSQVLGKEFKPLVPETSLKTIPSEMLPGYQNLAGVGSCQLKVDNFTAASKTDVVKQLSKIPLNTLIQMGGYDALIGHMDRHKGNYGFDPTGRMYLVDNGIAFGSMKKPQQVSLGFLEYNRVHVNYAHLNEIGRTPMADYFAFGDYKAIKGNKSYKLAAERAIQARHKIVKIFRRFDLPMKERRAFWERAFRIKYENDLPDQAFEHHMLDLGRITAINPKPGKRPKKGE